jgi:hypothetical protein
MRLFSSAPEQSGAKRSIVHHTQEAQYKPAQRLLRSPPQQNHSHERVRSPGKGVLVGVPTSSSTLLSLTRTFFLLTCPVSVGVPSIPPLSRSPTGVPPLASGLDLPAATMGGGGWTCSIASSDAEAPDARRDSERV